MARTNRLARLPRVGELSFSCIPNDVDHDGWLKLAATTRNVSRTLYPKLFEKFGVFYGAGDGSTTFGLPAAGDRFLLASGTLHAFGAVGGAERVTLTLPQLPAHAHTEDKPTAAATASQMGLLTSVLGISLQTITKPPTVTVASGDTGSAGGGQSHENMPPFLAVDVFVYAGMMQ